MQRFILAVHVGASVLIAFSPIEWFFKGLLIVLLGLTYYRQQFKNKDSESIKEIEFRRDLMFLKKQNDLQSRAVLDFSYRQNRIFTELQLHLKGHIIFQYLWRDSFSSKAQFSGLMQQLRFFKIRQ